MNRDKVNELQLLGTIKNADESGIIVYADQVYDKQASKSIEARVDDLASAVNAVDQAVKAVNQFDYQVVASLPATPGEDNMYKIYLVKIEGSNEADNIYNEYIVVKTGSGSNATYKWEHLGTTAVDLSDYAKTADVNTSITNAINALDSEAGTDNPGTQGHIAVKVTQKDGKITGVSVVEQDIASQTTVQSLSETVSKKQDALEKYSESGDIAAIKAQRVNITGGNSTTPTIAVSGNKAYYGGVDATNEIVKKSDLSGYLTSHQDISGKQDKLKQYKEVNGSSTPTVQIGNEADAANKIVATDNVTVRANSTIILKAGNSGSANTLTLTGNTTDGILKLGDDEVALVKDIPTDDKIKAIKVSNAGHADTANSATTASSATTATTATNLVSAPTIAAGTNDANKITVTVGNKTSAEFTVPYSTKANAATSAASATKATQDGDGNTISSTYLKSATASSTYATIATVNTKADSSKVYSKTDADAKFATIDSVNSTNLSATVFGTKTYNEAEIDKIFGN